MYSEQLEAIIQSVIADGVITEKERAVLHKKAETEGIDADEIDVYVDGLIAQMKNNGEEVATAIKEHDLALFVKETSSRWYNPVYYKLKKVYLVEHVSSSNHTVNDILITFVDVTDANNKEVKNWERHMGMGLLFSVNVNGDYWGTPTLCFSSNGDDFLSLACDREYNSFQCQCINDKSADETIAYKIDKEDLQALCKTEDIQVRFLSSDDDRKYIKLPETSLPGFQYYAQYFYRVMIDPEAYPDAEKHLKSLKKTTQEKRVVVQKEIGDKTEQQLAGILSRKVKGKRIKPTPYYMKQYKVLDAVVTDISGRIVTRQKNDYETYTPHLFLHAITTKEDDYVFYICITSHWSIIGGKTVVLSINLQDYTLLPVTDNISFLSDKNPHKEKDNDKYNFYYIDKDTLNAFLNAKDATLKVIDGGVEERKIPSIPKKWKKAYEMLGKKDNLKEWSENTGVLSKFCQTYFQIAVPLMMVYVVLALIILFLILF